MKISVDNLFSESQNSERLLITHQPAVSKARNERAGDSKENEMLVLNRQPGSCWGLKRRNPFDASIFYLSDYADRKANHGLSRSLYDSVRPSGSKTLGTFQTTNTRCGRLYASKNSPISSQGNIQLDRCIREISSGGGHECGTTIAGAGARMSGIQNPQSERSEMNIIEEVWRPVRGYEGIYEVSNAGKIKSLSRVEKYKSSGKGCKKTFPERILKQTKGGKGKYFYVGLHHPEKSVKTATVHGLVFRAFVENPNKLPEINHIDGNKENNFASNLEPSTRQQNCRHAIDHGLLKIRGTQNRFSKLSEEKVIAIRNHFKLGKSQTEISIIEKVPLANVHCIVRRKSWRHLIAAAAPIGNDAAPRIIQIETRIMTKPNHVEKIQ